MIGSVVVLYNPTKEEVRNINTYLSNVDYAVVVDNSNVNNEVLVKSILLEQNKIQYYSREKNLGLCKALNIGVNMLKTKGCKWALLFDADSKLGADIISIYQEAIKKYQGQPVALFAPVHVFDRSRNKPYHGYKRIDWSMTSGWCVNIDIFEKQNGFFEKLFVDGLDMDYCFKSYENGYEVIECGEAVINHRPAKTKSFLGLRAPNKT